MGKVVAWFAVRFGVLAAVTVVFLSYVVQKKILLKTFEGWEDIAIKIIAACMLVFVIWKAAIPMLKDVPYLIKKDFQIISGETMSQNSGGYWKHPRITVENKETGEKMKVKFSYKMGIAKRDQVTVQYLPNSGEGLLIEINGVQQNDMIE